MDTGRMEHLATVAQGFEAQLLVARLGAEGVLWELRGTMGGPLPLSSVGVFVDRADMDKAREILELDPLDVGDPTDRSAHTDGFGRTGRLDRTGRSRLVTALLLAVIIVVALVRAIGPQIV